VRLAQHPAAAIGLGLRRLVELTHGPTALGKDMARELLDLQDADGSYSGDPLATACVAAGLSAVLREHFPNGDIGSRQILAQDEPKVPEIVAAHARTLASLTAMQGDQPGACGFRYPDDRTAEDRALVAAFVLWLLAPDPQFRQAVRFAELLNWFEQRRNRLAPETHLLWSLARVAACSVAGHSRRPTPAAAA
jgi:hypothetical protein